MRSSLLYSSAVAVISAGSASAQTVAPSQIVPPTAAPAERPIPQNNLTNDIPSAPQSPAVDLTVTLGTVEIRGAFDELAQENHAFIKATEKRRMSLAALFDAARTLEQAYARHGYVLARVIVPPQRISAETPLVILVIDGFVDSLDLSGVPAHIRPAVHKRLQGLINRPHLTLKTLERKLLLAGELAGVRLRSALKSGTQPGGVALIVEGETDRVNARMDIGNMLPTSLGQWQWNTSLSVNNLLGLGDQAYAILGSQLDADLPKLGTDTFAMVGGGLTVPVRSDGTTLGGEYVRARTRPNAVIGTPLTIGRYQRAELRISNPLILTRQETLRFNGSVSWIRQALHASDFNIDLSRDDYAAARLSLDWQRTLPRGTVSAFTRLSRGIAGREGTRLVPLSRQGASTAFTRIDGNLRAETRLGRGFGLMLIGRGQSAFGKPLLLSEQFSLDGQDGVSAFASGSFNADSGVTVRGELSHVLPIGNALVVAPYLYGAGGRGWLASPTAVERGSFTASSLGAGARIAFSHGGVSQTVGVEVGRQFTNIANRREGVRANLTFGLRF